ncbi:MAG: hypothetical protein AAFN18_13775 [Cyanobacteria bacterium J06554_6]
MQPMTLTGTPVPTAQPACSSAQPTPSTQTTPPTQDNPSPQASLPLPAPAPNPDTVRHLLFGSPEAVKLSIKDLHRKHYAEPNDWSKLLPTGRPNEVMVILTRRVRLP